MASGPRPKFFKIGGVIAFLVLLFFYLSPNGGSVKDIVRGTKVVV